VPIIPNPTPPDPIPPDSEDELPDAFDPLDLNKDGIVDEDEAFVSDGTGLHPTRTTYAETIVMVSPTFGEETAVPTSSTYHRSYTTSELSDFNQVVSDTLVFNNLDHGDFWGAYGPRPDYVGRKYSTGKGMPDIWVDGFAPPVSWDWTSPMTNNDYSNICPRFLFYSKGGVFSSSKISYYFFVEVYNDYQAVHGYANFDFDVDGFPAVTWPGMVKAVYSVGGAGQRPKERMKYERYFADRYGHPFAFAAPEVWPETYLGVRTVPTRFRTIRDFDNTGPVVRDPGPSPPEPEEERLEAPPTMQTLTTPITVGKPGAGVATEAWNPVSRGTAWLKVVSNVVPAGYTGEYTSQLAAQGEANSHIVINMPSDTAKGWCAQPGITGQSDIWYYDERFSVFSAYVTTGSTSQCVGLITTTKAGATRDGVFTAGAATGGSLIVSPYGLTSTAARAYVDGQDNQLLAKPGGMEGILAVAPSNPVAFMYDASIGNWGKVTWLSHF